MIHIYKNIASPFKKNNINYELNYKIINILFKRCYKAQSLPEQFIDEKKLFHILNIP
jgi:hypothetical protein